MAGTDLYDGPSASVETRDGDLAVLTVAPGDGAFGRDLQRAVAAVADAAPGALVLTGEPGAFAAAPAGGPAVVEATVPSAGTQLVCDAVAALDRPVVGALRGEVSDAGLALALGADLLVAGESSSYGVPAVTAGAEPTETLSRQLEASVGRDRAGKFSSAGDFYDAETAREWGLVNEVVADGAVRDRALTLAGECAERPALPYRYLKWAVGAASPVPTSGFEFGRGGPELLTSAAAEPDLSGERADGRTVTVDEPRAGVARLTLARRHRLNAISGPMIADFRDAVADVADRDPTAVVVEGAGRRAFSIGLDRKAPIARASDPARGAAVSRLGQAMTGRLSALDAPVVAAVEGRAFGGGLEIALAADARVGGESSTYGFPEITHGLLPAAGGTQRLPAAVGLRRAKELLYTGAKYDADTLARWGALSTVVPDERVTEAALDAAERLAEEGVESVDRRSFGTDGRPTARGALVERVGLARAFSLDPFGVAADDSGG